MLIKRLKLDNFEELDALSERLKSSPEAWMPALRFKLKILLIKDNFFPCFIKQRTGSRSLLISYGFETLLKCSEVGTLK